ncbi:Cyanovirin-N-like protein [Penicillium chrysogenum]|nr:Cyanovirin-N-like protein [Penicillium chrysogenum]
MIHTLYTLLCILLSQIDTMSFHETASHIELEDGHILKAVLRNEEGDEQESTLDLNDHIGNDNGHFHWDGGDFHSSAEDVSFDREGDDEIPVLRARLHDVEGELQDADINLAERIGNDNGNLVFN